MRQVVLPTQLDFLCGCTTLTMLPHLNPGHQKKTSVIRMSVSYLYVHHCVENAERSVSLHLHSR